MFIELTDHLRCPADHDEAFLVLLPDRLEGRSVRTGTLGCPICGRRFVVRDGILDTGGAETLTSGQPASGSLGAEAMAALVGLGGPGGYLVLVGPPAALWREVMELVPGVALVAVNPPAPPDERRPPGSPDPLGPTGEYVSVLRGGRLALKTKSMRGVVLGTPYGGDAGWVAEAARVVLPGLRVVGEGPVPPPEWIELMASADGVWVGTRRR